MTGIEEFKGKLRSEVETARERVQTTQTQAAEQYRQLQANYERFLDLSQRARESLRPWVEAFGEALPDVTPVVTQRDFGPAGRVFHGVFVTFSLPHGSRDQVHEQPTRRPGNDSSRPVTRFCSMRQEPHGFVPVSERELYAVQ